MTEELTQAAERAVETAKGLTAADIAHHPMRNARTGQVAAIHPAQMIEALITRPDVDLDKVEKLFELQERYEANEAKKAYFDAVSKFQAEVPVIHKDQTVDYASKGSRTVFDFSSLPQIIKTVRPLLAKHGLTLTWRTGTTDTGNPVVTAVLTHELGYGEDTTLSAPVDVSGGKNAIQGVRSAWSYLRRLTAESILGIATGYDDDDDGASAGDRTPAHQEPVDDRPSMGDEAFRAALGKAQDRLTSQQACDAFANKLRTKYKLKEEQVKQINSFADRIPF